MPSSATPSRQLNPFIKASSELKICGAKESSMIEPERSLTRLDLHEQQERHHFFADGAG
jgi:hypothetical protein